MSGGKGGERQRDTTNISYHVYLPCIPTMYILPCIPTMYTTMYILPYISYHVYPTMYTYHVYLPYISYHVYPSMCWGQSTALRHQFSPSSTLFGGSRLSLGFPRLCILQVCNTPIHISCLTIAVLYCMLLDLVFTGFWASEFRSSGFQGKHIQLLIQP